MLIIFISTIDLEIVLYQYVQRQWLRTLRHRLRSYNFYNPQILILFK